MFHYDLSSLIKFELCHAELVSASVKRWIDPESSSA